MSQFLKIDGILSFSLNFLKRSKKFSSKLTLELCQWYQQRKPYLFTTSILMKKSWSDLKNLTKNDQIASFFSKIRTKLKLKQKLEDQLNIFEQK